MQPRYHAPAIGRSASQDKCLLAGLQYLAAGMIYLRDDFPDFQGLTVLPIVAAKLHLFRESPFMDGTWTGARIGEESMFDLRSSMWKSTLLSSAVFGLMSLTAVAQKVEIFGGYQFTHLQPAFNASGWNASLTGNFKHVLGITADFSGAYKQNLHSYTYTFGPVLTARLPVVQPFVHALFGGIRASDGGSSTGFAMLVGGGIDLGLRKGIGFRIVQVDWLSTRFSGNTSNKNVRASAGIVLKF